MGISIDAGILWVIAGVLLILSELLATSIVAVFFGLSAIAVGILMSIGVITTPTEQLVVFSAISVLLLATARNKAKAWFKGESYDSDPTSVKDNIGQHVTVAEDFVSGRGRVILNGVEWDAQEEGESDEPLKKGDRVEVVRNESITLFVNKVRK